jgi:hypothetical protein
VSADFDPWREKDLLRFLRTFAQMLDEHDRVEARDVGMVLNLDDDTTRRAQQRLRTLGLLETSPTPQRAGDGELSTGRILTDAGVRAAISGKLL